MNPSFVPAGTARVATGTFTSDNTDNRQIAVPFRPRELRISRRTSTSATLNATAVDPLGNETKIHTGNGVSFGTGTSLLINDDGFLVGATNSDAPLNAGTGNDVDWVAYR